MDCRQPSPLRFASDMPNPHQDADWYKSRSYLHFDLPLSYESARDLVCDPNRIATHAFFPLIRFVITSKKLARESLPHKFEHKPKEREIRYASHADAHIYSFYAFHLQTQYESMLSKSEFQESVLAFRRLSKSNIHFARDAFQAIRNVGNADVLGLDIKDFFGSLDHEILKKRWIELIGKPNLPPDQYKIYRSVTQYSWVDRKKVYRIFNISEHNPKVDRRRICDAGEFREQVRASKIIETNSLKKGIPQGTPISALLSNIYMAELDREFSAIAKEHGGKYFRYCDDILLIVSAGLGDVVQEKIKAPLAGHKLEVQDKKTEFRKFRVIGTELKSEKPLQYLGFLFDGGKVVLRSSALARFSEKMNSAVRLAKLTTRSRNLKRSQRNEPEKPLGKKKLYRNYSYLGRRNFISYALRASEILESRSVKKQVKPLWRRLKKAIQR